MNLAQTALSDVRTGRFERSLSALTAAGAAVTAAEIYLSHDGASFGNKMMWWPVVIVPAGIPAAVAAVFSRRAARTVLPLASAAIVANGLQGTYLHWRGIRQRPGGWTKYNMESGPPMSPRCWPPWSGEWVCSPRSSAARTCRCPATAKTTDALPTPGKQAVTPQNQGRYPGYDVLDQIDVWDNVTAGVVLARLGPPGPVLLYTDRGRHRLATAGSLASARRRTTGTGAAHDRPASRDRPD